MVSPRWQHQLKPAISTAFHSCFEATMQTPTNSEDANLAQEGGQNGKEYYKTSWTSHEIPTYAPVNSARNRPTLTARRVVILTTSTGITGGSNRRECLQSPAWMWVPPYMWYSAAGTLLLLLCFIRGAILLVLLLSKVKEKKVSSVSLAILICSRQRCYFLILIHISLHQWFQMSKQV